MCVHLHMNTAIKPYRVYIEIVGLYYYYYYYYIHYYYIREQCTYHFAASAVFSRGNACENYIVSN